MNTVLEKFEKQHEIYIKKWECEKEIFKYLSHSKPRGLRDTDKDALKRTNVFMLNYNDRVIGSTWIEDITEVDCKLGIYIGEVEYREKGIGTEVIKKMLSMAFTELNLQKVYLNVRGKNTRAINCYEKIGFEKVKEYNVQRYTDGSLQKSFLMEIKMIKRINRI